MFGYESKESQQDLFKGDKPVAQKCYVILGSAGTYDTYHVWIVSVWLNETHAKEELAELQLTELTNSKDKLGRRRRKWDDTYYELEEHDLYK